MANWQNGFKQEHINTAAERYGVNKEGIVKVGGFDNLVYKFEHNGYCCILRVSHSSHRDEKQIQAELDWISYLANHGVRVSKPLPSIRNLLLEMIDSESGVFILTAFERAQGEHINADHKAWGPDLFEEWGYITGTMHACAKSYEISMGAPRRITDDEIPITSHRLSAISTEEQIIYRKFRESEKLILELPKSNKTYGLCHRDLHQGNFFVHNGKITAFDFDDCGYDYFIQDIAMAVYYASIFPKWHAPVKNIERITEFGNRFLSHFMTGYERTNHLDHFWIKQLPLFIEKRRSDLCLILFEEWGPEHNNKEQREWLHWNVESIKNDIPCMQLEV